MKKILYFLFLIPSFLIGDLANNASEQDQLEVTSEEDELKVNRHTLNIFNSTHKDGEAPGRDLFLIWTGRVHKPPQITHCLKPGNYDSRNSEGCGYGGNKRTFTIEVYRLLNGRKLRVGKFDHRFDTLPGEWSHEKTSDIIKICTNDSVDLYVTQYHTDRIPTGQFLIGSVPRSQW